MYITEKPFVVLYQVITHLNPGDDHFFLSQENLPAAGA